MRIKFALNEISRSELRQRSAKLSKMGQRFLGIPLDVILRVDGKTSGAQLSDGLDLLNKIMGFGASMEEFLSLCFITPKSTVMMTVKDDISAITIKVSGYVQDIKYMTMIHITGDQKIEITDLYARKEDKSPAGGIGGIIAATMFHTAMNVGDSVKFNPYSNRDPSYSDGDYTGAEEWAPYVSDQSKDYQPGSKSWKVEMDRWTDED